MCTPGKLYRVELEPTIPQRFSGYYVHSMKKRISDEIGEIVMVLKRQKRSTYSNYFHIKVLTSKGAIREIFTHDVMLTECSRDEKL